MNRIAVTIVSIGVAISASACESRPSSRPIAVERPSDAVAAVSGLQQPPYEAPLDPRGDFPAPAD